MIISVASGKGGTGKTTVAVSMALALISSRYEVTLLDCDVEEPNAHIFINPEYQEMEEICIGVPEINREKCNLCGKCAELCAFNALLVAGDNVIVYSEMCHGCGGCSYFCPEGAVQLKPRTIGAIETGIAGEMGFVRGRLEVGAALSPPLVDAVKKRGSAGKGVVIIDAPPGTSCPVIHAVRGTDYCLLVTEPTPFGLNDLDLSVQMVRSLGVPCGVLINRARDDWGIIEKYCRREGLEILMKIPLSQDIARAYSRGVPLAKVNGDWDSAFRQLYLNIRGLIVS